MKYTLSSPLRPVVGDSSPKIMRAWEISTLGELLDILPRAYLDPHRPADFASMAVDEPTVFMGTVRKSTVLKNRNRKGSRLVVTVVDGAGREMDLTFFSRFGHQSRLQPDTRLICFGTVREYRGRLQLAHPDYQIVFGPDDLAGPETFREGPIPIYRQAKGLSSMLMTSSIELALHAFEELDDPIPDDVRREHGLPTLLEAYRLVHQPATEADFKRGRWRLKWQEAFVTQAALAQRRRSAKALPSMPRLAVEGGLAQRFREQLPFTLTESQEQVLTEINSDLASAEPMHRLLQGEVGSGKTVVALLAMLTVIDSGGQAALLAPTEVLAVQHHRSITAMLGRLAEGGLLGGDEQGTRVALLTGSQPMAERRANLLMSAIGEAGIVVGTHALIQEHVQFFDLGLVVVDEQHRFGVEQRDALRAKADDSPHVLVMTATPIPRTVAMTVFGDMETSVMAELPRGRQPITSHVVTPKPGWVQRTWQRVAEEVGRGGQVYVVCPRIGDDDDPVLPEWTQEGPGGPIPPEPGEENSIPMHGVLQVEQALRELPATAALRLGRLHGRQATDEKDATMRAFADGELDVLVATTVIEVGVNVPNATQMVVLDADRFGISQLHQLRGRIGRGGKPGLCLLVCQAMDGPAVERLEGVAATNDGFELAQLDLEQRREGDVLGSAQSGGHSTLKFLRLTRDEELIAQARTHAWAVVGSDPDLDDHPALREMIARIDAEQAAFLERG